MMDRLAQELGEWMVVFVVGGLALVAVALADAGVRRVAAWLRNRP